MTTWQEETKWCLEQFVEGHETRSFETWARITKAVYPDFAGKKLNRDKLTTLFRQVDLSRCRASDIQEILGEGRTTTVNYLQRYLRGLVKINPKSKIYSIDEEGWLRFLNKTLENKEFTPHKLLPVIDFPRTQYVTDETIDSPAGSIVVLLAKINEDHLFLTRNSSRWNTLSESYPTVGSMLDRFCEIHGLNNKAFYFNLMVWAIRAERYDLIKYWVENQVEFKTDPDENESALEGLLIVPRVAVESST